MKHTRAAGALRWAAPICAAALTALRIVTLKTAFQENGLLPQGSPVLPLTVFFCVCVFAVLCLLSLRLNRLPGTERCFTQHPVSTGCKMAAAILVILGAALTRVNGQKVPDLAQRLTAFAGIGAGFCMLFTAVTAERGPHFFWLRLLPALCTGALLILYFRVWSHDPLVIHITPLLLAWTCAMVEMMLLCGFPLEAGHRRSAVLFGLSTGVFACMSVPDYFLRLQDSLADLVLLLGVALWCADAGLELLRERVQTEEAPAEPEQEAEAETQNAE